MTASQFSLKPVGFLISVLIPTELIQLSSNTPFGIQSCMFVLRLHGLLSSVVTNFSNYGEDISQIERRAHSGLGPWGPGDWVKA